MPVDGQDGLERVGGALVVEELLVVEAGDALVEVDLLPRRGRERHLPLEVVEQLLVPPVRL